MEDRNIYLQRLGLNPDDQPSREDIEKQYEKCISEHMVCVRQGKTDEQIEAHMAEITDAYNHLTGRDKEKQDNKWFQGFNVITLKNFVYLFKLQIAAVIFILMCAGITVYEIATRETFDFQVITAGYIKYDFEKFEASVKKVVPDVEGVTIKTMEAVSYEGFVAQYVAGDVDIICTTAENFEQFAKENFLMNLSDLAKEYKIDLKPHQDFIVRDKDDETPQLYGIDVTNCPSIKDAFMNDDNDVIFCVLRRKEPNEKVLKFLEQLLTELK